MTSFVALKFCVCSISLAVLFTLVGDAAADDTKKPIDFSHDVVPILRQHCIECHGGQEAKGSFSINTRELLIESGYVDEETPSASYLLELVTSTDPDLQMPPKKKPRVPAKDIEVLQRWLAEGLPWEAGFSFAPQTYEPPLKPRRPELPPIVDGRDNPIDRILDHYLREHNLPRPDAVDDATFLRRVHLDLIGLLPEPAVLDQFLADSSPDKRARLVRELLSRDLAYAEHWLTFFNDLLRNDYSGTGFITGGRRQISSWLYSSLVANMPFDEIARELIAPTTTASQGYIDGIRWRGTVSAGQSVEIQFAQSVSQSFLGLNLKCASCHDSFIDRWKLDEAYGLAAVYATEPLTIHRCDKPLDRTAKAGWLFPELGNVDPEAPRDVRLQQLANLMTHPENGRFTRTIVNRLWYRLMGRGIVHPLDAMQSPPWNADLLDYLAVYLADHDYDLKQVLELIATSQAYASQCEIRNGETDAEYVYRGPRARRMTAEQLLDAIWQLTGSAPRTFDAPVFRGKASPEELAQIALHGKWIWGETESRNAPAGQSILLRKQVTLADEIARGAAIITCDNAFRLFINGREIDQGDDWTQLHGIALHGLLRKGDNQIAVIATNAGSSPNPAGLFFEAQLRLKNGDEVNIPSDETWQWSLQVPNPREGRLGAMRGPWKPAAVISPVKAWTEAIDAQARQKLAIAVEGDMPMVRASLLKNNALMRSLGRPTRDQIVSMRPDTLTTLEAIDLANEATLAASFAAGGEKLAAQSWADRSELVNYMFRFALSRRPTEDERAALSELLGEEPSPQAIADAVWAICMLPEFMVIR